jgi:hypothetical protein
MEAVMADENYMLELYIEGAQDPSASWQSDHPWMAISVGDKINGAFWDLEAGPHTPRYIVTNLEHIISQADDLPTRHKIMVTVRPGDAP